MQKVLVVLVETCLLWERQPYEYRNLYDNHMEFVLTDMHTRSTYNSYMKVILLVLLGLVALCEHASFHENIMFTSPSCIIAISTQTYNCMFRDQIHSHVWGLPTSLHGFEVAVVFLNGSRKVCKVYFQKMPRG